MKTRLLEFIFVVLSFCIAGEIPAQTLNGFIGSNSMPDNNDSICAVPLYTGSFYTSGFSTGDSIPDFKLYDLSGDSLLFSETFGNGKPKLLVAGSYTCPVFRNRMTDLNQVVSTYGSALDIFIIYVVEAHPIVDVSPYSGSVWTTAQNGTDSVLFKQPKTYGERKQIVSEMISDMGITVPVFIDGVCNDWWLNFGPAPNNAYLIDTNGIVFAKQGWFNKSPDNIFCEIDSILGNPINPACSGGGTGGTFNFILNEPATKTSIPGSVITIYGTLSNNSSQSAVVDIIRIAENLPVGWTSAMCTDICLPYWVDTTFVQISPGSTQSYIMYFYTDAIEDTGRVRIRFSNRNIPGNSRVQNYMGITDSSLSTSIESFVDRGEPSVIAIPNPSQGEVTFEIANVDQLSNAALINIIDLLGNHLLQIKIDGRKKIVCNLHDLNNGLYFYQLTDGRNRISTGRLVLSR